MIVYPDLELNDHKRCFEIAGCTWRIQMLIV